MPERTADLQDILEQIAYEEGYNAALEDTRRKAAAARRNERARRKERKYFWIQRAAGLLLILLSVAAVPVLDYDATFCLITAPLGTGLFFTKKHILEIMGYEYDETEQKRG